jgi:hypothetical protein
MLFQRSNASVRPKARATRLPARADRGDDLGQQPGRDRLLAACVRVASVHGEFIRRYMAVDEDDPDISRAELLDDRVAIGGGLSGGDAMLAVV